MDNKETIQMFSDGSCLSNPSGPGGYGVIIKHLDANGKVVKVEEFAEKFESTTNNRMELMGVITGLESLKTPSKVSITTDSSYVVNAFTKNWLESWKKKGWKGSTGKPVKNPDLWKRLDLIVQNHDVTFIWVKGHAGHPENERCDYLAFSMANDVPLVKNEKGIYEIKSEENEKE